MDQAEVDALGHALAAGYESLPVPATARRGKPRANDFCTGSGACSEEVFVLPATVSSSVLVAWYDAQLGPTEIPWRDWQPCVPGLVIGGGEGSERSWVRPNKQVLRLYVFGADREQAGPYVRITKGTEDICGDG